MTGSPNPSDLERQLLHLGEDVRFPPTPAFSLKSRPAVPPSRMIPAWWRAGLAAAAALVLLALVVPEARQAVGSWLGVPGIRIEIGDQDDDPSPVVTSIGGSLLLGQPATLAEVNQEFPVALPGGALAAVDPEIYLNRFEGQPVVSLLYPASETLPAIGTTGVGLLLMQVEASGDTPLMMVKRAAVDASPLPVTVNGQEGFWIAGGMLVTDAGDPFWSFARRSGNVLVWHEDGVTYRIESSLPLADALAIAGSLAPLPVD